MNFSKRKRFVKETHNCATSGFTLIEVIIVLAVVGIMAAIAVPNFYKWLPGMKLKGASRDLYSNMQKARMQAVKENRDISIRFNTATTPGFYYFDMDDDGSYTAGEFRQNLASYKYGIDFFSDSAPTNWNNDPCTMASVITFSKTGTANSGTVYLENEKKTIIYAVTSHVYGAVKIRKYNGSSW